MTGATASPRSAKSRRIRHEVSDGLLDYPWPAQVANLIAEGGYDLILSIGQVVPHEVIGMANYNKNVFVGTGGVEGINKSHFLGAVYGMERIMGRADTPSAACSTTPPTTSPRTCPSSTSRPSSAPATTGRLAARGLYIGDDIECFERASALSLEVNFRMMDREIRKAVVYLDPAEFKSTWLGNKSVYRTRMAIADGGELIVLAPGVQEFGEDHTIDG
jgi:nickel-dependent lactate racemase